MTLQNDNQDPGFWRRGLSKRGQLIIAVVAGLVILGVLVALAVTGIPLF